MGLIEDLGAGPVALDTPVFIYLIERHPRYLDIVKPVFAAIDAGELAAVVSPLTLLEVLVVPFREGDLRLADRYEEILVGSRGLEMTRLGLDVFRAAAQIRALTGVKTPDALQLAGASAAGCAALLTNDRAMPATRRLRVLMLDDYA